MPSEAYVFDLVRVGKGISVLDRRTGQQVYSIKFERRTGLCFLARAGTTLHRAPVNDKGALPDPYATIHGRTIELVKVPSRPTKKYAKKDFLKNAKKGEYLVVAIVFNVNDNDYVFKTEGKSFELFSVESTTPLALFRRHSRFSHSIGSIRIDASAVAEGKDENKHALIRDGKPTWLLDVALAVRRLMGS